MGFLGRMFGVYTPEERIARARAFLESKDANEARLELEGVEHPDAAPVRAQALAALIERNLDEARAHLVGGDEELAREHLEMAQQFGATGEDLRKVRRMARELRAERKEQAALAAQAEVEARAPEGDDPLWSLPPDDPRVRFAMLVEGYPGTLRERLAVLGKDFASAVLQIEEGDPKAAWEALSAFVEREPAARFERARAALATGDLARAASDLAFFGDTEGHQRIGALHTGVTLARLYLQLGRLPEALATTEQGSGQGLDVAMAATRAQVLEAMGRLPEAEDATTALLMQAPKELELYRMLGRLKLRRGDRAGATQALESGLSTCNCDNPGKCGYRPPDVTILRMLARIYLEDRQEPKRAHEVVSLLQGIVQEPTWDDAYVVALAARNDGDPQVSAMIAALRAKLPPGDARLGLLATQFQGMLGQSPPSAASA